MPPGLGTHVPLSFTHHHHSSAASKYTFTVIHFIFLFNSETTYLLKKCLLPLRNNSHEIGGLV